MTYILIQSPPILRQSVNCSIEEEVCKKGLDEWKANNEANSQGIQYRKVMLLLPEEFL